MFTRYDYKAGSTAANVVADIIKLMTGTTDKTLLSSDCVQASTVIINDGVTRPAGWTLWDAAAGTNNQSLRAKNYDDVSYKYVNVTHNGTTGLFFPSYESWNATTHVGTNLISGSNTSAVTVNLAVGGTVYLSCSARGVIACGAVTGNFDNGVQMLMEHSRDEPWDTPAYGIPPYAFVSGATFSTSGNSAYCYKPRMKSTTLSDLINNGAYMGIIGSYAAPSSWSSLIATAPGSKVRDANLNLVHAFSPMIVLNGGGIGLYGKMFDVFLTTNSYGSSGDEIDYNSNTYFIMACSSLRIAVPKF